MENQRRNEDMILGLCRETVHDLYDSIATCYAGKINRPKLRREMKLDLRTISSGVRIDGLNYLSQVLPRYGKYLDMKLKGFRYEPTGLSLNFLRLAWPLVDIAVDSVAISDDLGALIKRMRTLFYLVYKLETSVPQHLVDLAIQQFVETEREVANFSVPSDGYGGRLVKEAHEIAESLLRGFNLRDKLIPRHGPGSVATGEKGDNKWVFTHLYDSLHQRFPYYDFMYGIRSNGRSLMLKDMIERYMSMKRLPYPVARLCIVPKDSRGPRIISCEPLELQFMQQAVARPLMRYLELHAHISHGGRNYNASRHINFTDQSINGELALSSSEDGQYATIDLSEASDRVSQALFEAIWPKGQIADLNALRSHATLLPNGDELTLRKFAPMGSALCFPVESTIFFCVVVAALYLCGVPIGSAIQSTYVYGDDIIVPTKYVYDVCQALTIVGLKVNDDKSCTLGSFRESCGVDAFKGKNVTPIRIRKIPGYGPRAGTEHVAWLAYASHFLSIGMKRAASYCIDWVSDQVGEEIPRTPCPVGYLSVVDPSNVTPMVGYKHVKWDSEHSSFTAIVFTIKVKADRSQLDGWDGLNRALLSPSLESTPTHVTTTEPVVRIAKRRACLTTVPFLVGVPS